MLGWFPSSVLTISPTELSPCSRTGRIRQRCGSPSMRNRRATCSSIWPESTKFILITLPKVPIRIDSITTWRYSQLFLKWNTFRTTIASAIDRLRPGIRGARSVRSCLRGMGPAGRSGEEYKDVMRIAAIRSHALNWRARRNGWQGLSALNRMSTTAGWRGQAEPPYPSSSGSAWEAQTVLSGASSYRFRVRISRSLQHLLLGMTCPPINHYLGKEL